MSLFSPEYLGKGQIYYANGVDTLYEYQQGSCQFLSKLAGGSDIHYSYNPTNGLALDVARCYTEKFGFIPPYMAVASCATGIQFAKPYQSIASQAYVEQWTRFHEQAGPNDKLLQICHSEATMQIKIGLENSPPEVRNRIIVLAIAPSEFISKTKCFDVQHYVSHDFIPYTDFRGFARAREEGTVTFLTPVPGAVALFDHSFRSPTYRPALEKHIENFTKAYQVD